jgi:plastocyanin
MKWQSPLLKISLAILLSTFNLNVFAAGENPQVIIKDFKFIPQEITIRRGQTINWENREKRQYHSVWFEALGEEEPDYFFPDETYEREFKETGTFPYRCGPHPKMTGTVHVTE